MYVLKITETITRYIFLQGVYNFGTDLPSSLSELVSGIIPAHITAHRSNLHSFFHDFFSKPRRTIKYSGIRNGCNDCYIISLAQFLFTRLDWFVNLEKISFHLSTSLGRNLYVYLPYLSLLTIQTTMLIRLLVHILPTFDHLFRISKKILHSQAEIFVMIQALKNSIALSKS